MIDINEQFDVPSPPQTVWDVISDPRAVVGCVSGAELAETNEDGSFVGVLTVKFGALRVKFTNRITLELDHENMVGHLTAQGKDAQGGARTKTSADFTVSPLPNGASRVEMTGEVQLSGKLASVIEAGATVVVRRLTNEFAENLTVRCKGGDTNGEGEASPMSAPAPRRSLLTWLRQILRKRRSRDRIGH